MTRTVKEVLMAADAQSHRLQRALELLQMRLGELPWAIIGATALGRHGYERLTHDIDILAAPQARDALDSAAGIRPRFAGAKKSFNIYGADKPVPLDVIVVGEGIGSESSGLVFPDITDDQFERGDDGVWVPKLATLITFKLYSGAHGHARKVIDWADVQRLIRHHGLTPEYAEQLPEPARPFFLELFTGSNGIEPGPDGERPPNQ